MSNANRRPLTSTYKRPQGLSAGEALTAIQERAGAEFDPGLLPAFKTFVESPPGLGANFMLRKQSDFVKQHFPSILQKFSSGNWDGSDLAELSSASLLRLSADAIGRVEDKVKAVIKDIAHLF